MPRGGGAARHGRGQPIAARPGRAPSAANVVFAESGGGCCWRRRHLGRDEPPRARSPWALARPPPCCIWRTTWRVSGCGPGASGREREGGRREERGGGEPRTAKRRRPPSPTAAGACLPDRPPPSSPPLRVPAVIEQLPMDLRDRFTEMREMDLQVQSTWVPPPPRLLRAEPAPAAPLGPGPAPPPAPAAAGRGRRRCGGPRAAGAGRRLCRGAGPALGPSRGAALPGLCRSRGRCGRRVPSSAGFRSRRAVVVAWNWSCCPTLSAGSGALLRKPSSQPPSPYRMRRSFLLRLSCRSRCLTKHTVSLWFLYKSCCAYLRRSQCNTPPHTDFRMCCLLIFTNSLIRDLCPVTLRCCCCFNAELIRSFITEMLRSLLMKLVQEIVSTECLNFHKGEWEKE